MSAVLRDDRLLLPMTVRQIDAVLAIELTAYPFPWTRGNFIDSLAAGYPAQVLYGAQGEMLGYFVAMEGVDELHLLNITVAPGVQGQGHARFMLDELCALSRARRAQQIWLEVRESNLRARDDAFVVGGAGAEHFGQGLPVAGLMRNPPTSASLEPSPLPNSTRPPETRSSMEMRSATRAGWLNCGMVIITA